MENRVAIFIDVENIHYSTLNAYSETPNWSWIVQECRKKGKISSIQAFGDWREFSDEIALMQKNGIQPIFVPLSQNGKSSLDCYLTVSAMKLFFQNSTIDTLILASGDRDYIPLIAELKALGKNIIILAVSDTLSSELRGMVDDIIEYEPPSILNKSKNIEDSRYNFDEVETLIIDTIRELEETSINDRWVNLASIGLELKRREPNFSHKNYGYSKLVNMLEDIDGIEVRYDNYEKTIAVARTNRSKSRSKDYEGVIININKGYGFIKPDNGDENLFFHTSNLENIDFADLEIGDRVSFNTINTERGTSADRVRLKSKKF